MTAKYVDKKWVDTKMKHTPVELFESNPDKFARFVKRRTQGDDDQDAPPQPAPKPSKVMPPAAPAFQKTVSAPIKDVGDLISLAEPVSNSDVFSDFQQAPATDNGYSDFQSSTTGPASSPPSDTNSQANQMQNLLNMLSQPQQPTMPQAQPAQAPKGFQPLALQQQQQQQMQA